MFILRLLLMMAQDVEVAPSFQPLLGLAANFLGSHESQVADPMIEANIGPQGERLCPLRGIVRGGQNHDAHGGARRDRLEMG